MNKIKDLSKWLLAAVMRRLCIGDYVFVSRWSDGDLNDPWAVGFLTEVGEDQRGKFYNIGDGKYYRHCRKITQKEGVNIIERGANVV
jgi:hypothetical protein